MAYLPPNGNNIELEISGNYSPPPGNAIQLNLGNEPDIIIVPKFIEVLKFNTTPTPLFGATVFVPKFIEVLLLNSINIISTNRLSVPLFREVLKLDIVPLIHYNPISVPLFREVLKLDISIDISRKLLVPKFKEVLKLSAEPTDWIIIELPTFKEKIGNFNLWIPTMIYPKKFKESLGLVITPKIITNIIFTIKNSLNVGSNFIIVNPISLTKDFIFKNSLNKSLQEINWIIKNRITDMSINPTWSIKNKIDDKDSIECTWIIKNIIGENDLQGTYSFYGNGPVIHKEGSHGGFE